MQNNPFFIVGCVRSGTTFLRDVLRKHPHLAAPEETHFFRWAEPFGGVPYRKVVSDNGVLKRHRAMDGIEEIKFQTILDQSTSRGDLYQRYMRLYIEKNKPGAQRWFDKTPQNIYGAALIAGEIPDAKFIHIVRHPFDVVSSLRIGKIVKVQNLVGACNYWNEAAEIIQVIKRAYPERVYEVKYEDFTRELHLEIRKVLSFLKENYNPKFFKNIKANPKHHDHKKLFLDEELVQIKRLCGKWGTKYGYFASDRTENVNFASIAG